jgi:hypothetical protein
MISQQKIKEWVDLYLKHIDEIGIETHIKEEEGYKFKAVDTFQKNFDINASNLAEMLERAIEQNNLVAGAMYLPRRVLILFAHEYEDDSRAALQKLFDESIEVIERINKTEEAFNNLLLKWNKKNENKMERTFIGVRFISLLLAFRYPNIHDAIKPREWKAFFKFVDDYFYMPPHTKSGDQYKKYIEYIESLRSYIKDIPKISLLRNGLTKGLDFHDDEFRWMAQDVIYVTARALENDAMPIVETIAPKDENIDIEEGGGELPTTRDRFTLEEDLQHFIGENFESLHLESDLKLFRDNTGRSGLYYPATGVGEIDVLAIDENGNYVVIELKRDRASDSAVAQLGRYMQWVDENLAKKDKKSVSGILIAYRGSRSLADSVKALRFPVQIKYYKLRLDLSNNS